MKKIVTAIATALTLFVFANISTAHAATPQEVQDFVKTLTRKPDKGRPDYSVGKLIVQLSPMDGAYREKTIVALAEYNSVKNTRGFLSFHICTDVPPFTCEYVIGDLNDDGVVDFFARMGETNWVGWDGNGSKFFDEFGGGQAIFDQIIRRGKLQKIKK